MNINLNNVSGYVSNHMNSFNNVSLADVNKEIAKLKDKINYLSSSKDLSIFGLNTKLDLLELRLFELENVRNDIILKINKSVKENKTCIIC